MRTLDPDNLSGRLRTRVTLQQVVQTGDGAGGYGRAWWDVADVWAEIIPLSGQERLDALQLTGFLSHRMTLRYRDDVTSDKRFLADGRALNIRAVINVENMDRVLEVLVEEGGAT